MKTPLTLSRLKHHFNYHWWQYLLVIAGCLMGWNLFFTTTAAKPAEDEQVSLVVYGVGDADVLNAWMENYRLTEFPDQEVFECSVITPDDSGAQAMLVRVAAGGEGDLIIVPKDQFQSYAESGAFAPLNESAAIMSACGEYGIAADKGRWRGADGNTRLYGIPVAELPLLNRILYGSGSESYLCIYFANGNQKVTEQLLCCMLRDMRTMPAAAESAEK